MGPFGMANGTPLVRLKFQRKWRVGGPAMIEAVYWVDVREVGMRYVLIGILVLGLLAPALDAAIQYEFRQTIRSDIESMPSGSVSGKAVIDGGKSRVDYLSGSKYPPGSYVISSQGASRVLIVNPARKEYAEVNVGAMAGDLGTRQIKIENLRNDLQKLDDQQIIAGYPTTHYRLHTTYDITVMFGSIALKQSVNTIIDKWTTNAFGDLQESHVESNALRTGNPQLDELIEAELSRISGFPLKQVVTVTTTSPDANRNRNPQIKLNPVRRQVSELIITSIRNAPVDNAYFRVPDDFQRAVTKQGEAGVHILAMEPDQ